jgi:hypothetical protein
MNEDYLSDSSSCSTSWCRFIPLLRFAIKFSSTLASYTPPADAACAKLEVNQEGELFPRMGFILEILPTSRACRQLRPLVKMVYLRPPNPLYQ